MEKQPGKFSEKQVVPLENFHTPLGEAFPYELQR